MLPRLTSLKFYLWFSAQGQLWERSLKLKLKWEKEKMLISSIFSFFHIVFYPFKEKLHHLYHAEIVFCKCFQFGQAKILSLSEEFHTIFFLSAKIDQGLYSFLPVRLSLCLSVCLFICLSAKTFTLAIAFAW